jgi:ferredoxin-NADP reductase
MTAFALLLTIASALLAQVASGAVLWIWRKRKSDLAMRLAHTLANPAAQPVGAWSGWRDFRVTTRTYEDAEHSQCSFYLAPVDGQALVDFQPGQYVVVLLDVPQRVAQNPSGTVPIARCYSLSERPHPSGMRITVKRALAPVGSVALPPGLASGYLLDAVQVDSVLKVSAPAGQFVLDADASVPVVLIAGGIGITPLLCMLQWCLAAQAGRAVYLYYGVRSSADHAFKATLETLAASHPALTLQVVYSAAGSHDVQGRDYHHTGFIDLALLRTTLPPGRHQWYLCGPPPMLASLVPALRAWVTDPRDIHLEAFGPASAPAGLSAHTERFAVPVVAWEVRLDRSGRTLVWDGRDTNLLDFVERNGVSLQSGCRSGSCGVCQTRLIAGTVRYPDPPQYTLPAGYCLPCIGTPASALMLDA